MSLKEKLEFCFEVVVSFICRFRWFFVALMLLLAVAALSQLKNLKVDMSDEGFLHEDDPILTDYLDFRDQFGRDDLIVLAIKSESIFEDSFLKKLAKLHQSLEDGLDHVDEINSMLNARNTYGIKDGIVVEDLLENWPESKDDFETLRKRVMSNPLYLNRLISEDGTFTTIMVRLDTYSSQGGEDDLMAGFSDELSMPVPGDAEQEKPPYLEEEEKARLVMEVHKIAESFQANDFQINIAGSPVIIATVKKSMRQDMILFIRLALLTIGLCLFLMFRRISGVFLPILVVALSLISTLATMAVLGVPIKLPTMILPSFILSVGVGYSVHILALFYHRFEHGAEQHEAIIHTLGHSGFAIVMTSLTTAGGLLSFITAKIAPVFDLGVFASTGVLFALLYSIIFLPAMLAVIPLKRTRRIGGNKSKVPGQTMTKILDGITNFSTSKAKHILAFSVVIVFLAGIGLAKLHFSHDVLSWLPETLNIHKATKTIDKELRGSVTLELVVDTGRENGLYDPTFLNQLEQLATELEKEQSLPFEVGKVMSVADIIKEIHLALNENRPEFYVIPQDEKLIPQEFLLFENSGSDDLEDVIDSRFQLARVTIKVGWQDAMYYVPFIKKVEGMATKIFGDENKVTTTGIMALFGRIIYASIYSAATSYMIAAGVITLLMIILIGSVRLGLISMVPNLTPILITMGIMGWFGISLNMFTMLIGSIAIGLAVDDTIHFVYNFQRYFKEHEEPVAAVHHTLQTTGRAMLTTTIVLSIGFFIFMFASMENLFDFGMLTGLAIILALLADFLMAPALMTLVSRSKAGKRALLS